MIATADSHTVEPADLSPVVLRSVRVRVASLPGRDAAVRRVLPRVDPVEAQRHQTVDEEPERWDGMS